LARKHHFVEGYGIVAEEIDFEYREESFLLGIGKFNPTFSYALKNKYYGVNGIKIVSSYQLYERLGFYVAMISPMFNARVNFFRNDTTFLSRSLINDRGDYNSKVDVGSEANIMENFSITVDFPFSDNHKFNLGFRKLAADNNKNKKSELGYVAGMEFLFEETRDTLGSAPAMELVFLQNHNGDPSKNTLFTLLNIPIFYDKWNFGLSWSAKIFKLKETGDNRIKGSNIIQASVGYTFKNGITIDFSRKYENDHRSTSDGKGVQNEKFSSWGVGISYLLKFE
jgi:hypothetical protein